MTNDKGETPLEIMGVMIASLIVLTIVMYAFGPLIDGLVYYLSLLGIQIADQRFQAMFNYPMQWFSWAFLVPGFFISVLFVWGIKTILKKHTYSAQNQGNQFDTYQEEF